MSRQNIGGDTKKRLTIMTETTDGFLISEADMQLRGPGDMEGTQQSGLAFNLKVASLARDGQILVRAREAAMAVLDSSEELPPLLAKELHRRFDKSVDWSLIS